jgi:hypothetical protein
MLAIIRCRIFCLSVCYPKIYTLYVQKYIFLPVDLHGCESWSFTLREERRLRVFGNRKPRTIFGPKRDEVIGE